MSHVSRTSQRWSADAWRGNYLRQRIGYVLDCETPVVLSLGKLRITDISTSGPVVKNHVSLNWCSDSLQHEKLVAIVVLGLSTASSSSSSSATPTSLPQEITGSIPIPASIDHERADERERWNPDITNTNGVTRLSPKYQNGCKNSLTIWWMKAFPNLLEPVSLLSVTHASSLHEPSLEPLRRVVSGHHSTHFPKDRYCEICQILARSVTSREVQSQWVWEYTQTRRRYSATRRIWKKWSHDRQHQNRRSSKKATVHGTLDKKSRSRSKKKQKSKTD